MASWATFRFHSGVMAGGLTKVILWMIWTEEKRGSAWGGGAEPAAAWGRSQQTHLFDLLPEETRDGGAGVEGDLHVIGGVQQLHQSTEA